MKLKPLIIAILIILILGLGGWAYWSFMMGTAKIPITNPPTSNSPSFQPLNGNGTSGTTGGNNGTTLSIGGTATSSAGANGQPPALRLLSASPVGGYSASTTASTTAVVWVDRGRGNVYEALGNTLAVSTLSNTIVPKIVDALWNKNLTAFVGSLYQDGDLVPTTVYAELDKQTTASSTGSIAPYELHGKNIDGSVIGYAASPDKSRILIVMDEDGSGVGYLASFNGQNMTRLFSTPLTQIDVSWPIDGTIVVATKASASYSGFLYFVNPKSGAWTKILGPIPGLSAVVSHDGKHIIYSQTSANDGVTTSIYSLGQSTSTSAVIHTIADKCAWGRANLNYVYCGVPTAMPQATYPDAWYLGTVSTSDKIWRVNASTGEVALLASLPDMADRSIDAFRLDLDPKDHFLYFMNKTDLSLWSLDLTGGIK